MRTTTQYRRLSSAEREEVSRGLAQGTELSAIARRLGRAPSTIAREVRHNSGKSGYRAFSAGNRAKARASSRNQGKSRLTRDERLRGYVMEKLRKRWSPREIVKRLAAEYPDDRTMRLSHEAIYRYIYVLPRGALKTTFIQALRQARAYRRKRKSRDHEETRGKIVEMLSIKERPHEVADRTIPGHWEGDLILGKHQRTALGTLVERTTRYTILVPLKAKDATSVRKAYAKELRSLPREITKTLTYDQGKEMSEHSEEQGLRVHHLANLGPQFFPRVIVRTETVAQIAVEPRLSARPVSSFVQQRSAKFCGRREGRVRRHLNVIRRRRVKCLLATETDDGTTIGDDDLRGLRRAPRRFLDRWRNEIRNAVDLTGMKQGERAQQRNAPYIVLAVLRSV